MKSILNEQAQIILEFLVIVALMGLEMVSLSQKRKGNTCDDVCFSHSFDLHHWLVVVEDVKDLQKWRGGFVEEKV